MTSNLSVLERAYELAREQPTVAAIRQQLSREGYVGIDAHLASPTVRKALKAICKANGDVKA